jgi:hypothetical protein
MRRWIAAVVAALFLTTATLHVFAHVGDTDSACAVCHVQQAGGVQAAAPRIVVSPLVEIELPSFAASRAVAVPVAAVPARGPPSLPV